MSTGLFKTGSLSLMVLAWTAFQLQATVCQAFMPFTPQFCSLIGFHQLGFSILARHSSANSSFAQMPPGSRGIFWTVKELPDLAYAPFAFALEAFLAAKKVNAFYEESESMADFIRLPKCFVDELRYWVSDWTGSLKLAASRMPVLFVHSQEHEWLPCRDIVALSDNLPNTEYIILNNASQLFVYNQPDCFAKSLRALVEVTTSHGAKSPTEK